MPTSTSELQRADSPYYLEEDFFSDFTSREAAQEYLDDRATSADKKKIDPDSNGKACDEGAYIFAGGDEPTTSNTAAASTASASSSALSMSSEEQAAQAEANCRLVTYAQEEGMSQEEANGFSTRVANEMADKMVDDPALTAEPAQNQVLDDEGVPRYSGCKDGEQ